MSCRGSASGHRRARAGVERGDKFQTLLGITGSGQELHHRRCGQDQPPTLALAPKPAAQLTSEFRELFPGDVFEYFVSLHDGHHQDSSINDEIDRLRHSATSVSCPGANVVIVVSVSAIYGLGAATPSSARSSRLARSANQRRSSVASSSSSTSATTSRLPTSSGCGATPSRCSPPGAGGPDPALRRRGRSASCPLTRRTGEVVEEVECRPVPGLPRHRRRAHVVEIELVERLAWLEKHGEAARGPAPPHAHHLRPRDDARDLCLLGHRDLLVPLGAGRSPGQRPFTLLG